MRRSPLLVAFALGAGACSPETAPAPVAAAVVEPAPPPQIVIAPPPASNAGMDDLRAENAQLRLNIAQIEGALFEAQAERDRYRAGLERAVDQLNAGQSARAAPSPTYAAPAAPARESARLSSYGAPQVQIAGDSIIVTGKLWNSGDVSGETNLSIELLLDGQVEDRGTEHVIVGPRSDVAWSHTFRTYAREGTYSARAVMER